MLIVEGWKDYKVIATGNGEKLEKWGNYTLLRPDPQVIWRAEKPLRTFKGIDAVYERSSTGGGKWEYKNQIPDDFYVTWEGLTFKLKLMGFKHTGLFPEQAVNWRRMMNLIEDAEREISVLNLFAYTGGATVACAKAGAKVCHVDGAKAMCERAGENTSLSNVDKSKVRFIIDDCFKFCQRELRRGHKYDAIILDPPSFGRGPNGEKWKLEDGISELVDLVGQLLSDNPLFVCLNSYTTGLQPMVMANILKLALKGQKKPFDVTADEIGIMCEDGLILPQGCTAFVTFK
jgi:23S rRNA (cytosine1962-C5)-methyltransferase